MFLFVFCVSAFADPNGFYVGGNAGLIVPRDSTFKDSGSGDTNVSYHPGFSIGALGGYKFVNNIRVEGEIGYKNAMTDDAKQSDNPSRKYDSRVSATDLMANAFYDIKTPYTAGFTPYLGGGIGLAVLMTSDGTVNGTGRTIDRSNDTVFAYQAGGGVAYDITKNVTLDLGYRYFGTTEGTLKTSVGTTEKVDFSNHNVILGVRYNF